MKKVFIKTFGCVQNTADSERVKAYFWDEGYEEIDSWEKAEVVVINTCIIRESAENRAYGFLDKIKKENSKIKIIVTGCLVGLHDKQEKIYKLKRRFPMVDEFIPIEEISFKINPLRDKKTAAMVPISSGCNNFCSYCIVPFARGREISRPMEEVIKEATKAKQQGFEEIILIGQNVNSYGADLTSKDEGYVSLGKKRFKSLFPILLARVAELNFKKVSFVSSNPWDFSEELIDTIARYPNIDRLLHLPIQAGDNEILQRMNRSYSIEDYEKLLIKIRKKINKVRISTDIIIGFPGETEEIFNREAVFFKKCDFDIAYLNKYSPRQGTMSAKLYKNDVSQSEKRRRWKILDDLLNKKLK